MNTGTKTTYILLERGVEDKALLKELIEIVGSNYPTFEFIKQYPMIHELMFELRNEVEGKET